MWGIIGHVTAEAGNTVGTDGAPPHLFVYSDLLGKISSKYAQIFRNARTPYIPRYLVDSFSEGYNLVKGTFK